MASDLDDLVARARAGLAGDVPDVGSQPASGGDASAVGTALDGKIRAVLGASRHLQALSIEPEAMQLPLADISAAIVTAVNDANAALSGGVDVAPVVEMLTRVKEQARSEAAALSHGLGQAGGAVRAMRDQS